MRIINGKRFYQKDIDKAEELPFKGWDSYDGRNQQWYTVRYNPDCGLTILEANNSGDCYGDYGERYYESPRAFYNAECVANDYNYGRDFEKLIGDVDEDNELAMKFLEALGM